MPPSWQGRGGHLGVMVMRLGGGGVAQEHSALDSLESESESAELAGDVTFSLPFPLGCSALCF